MPQKKSFNFFFKKCVGCVLIQLNYFLLLNLLNVKSKLFILFKKLYYSVLYFIFSILKNWEEIFLYVALLSNILYSKGNINFNQIIKKKKKYNGTLQVDLL